MNSWETLVASALVGTDRQSPAIDFTAPALLDYQASLQSQAATQQILAAAGLVSAYRSVGQGAAIAALPLSDAAAPEQLTCCSLQTTQHLGAILQENRYAKVLPELLQLLAQAHQTVPPDFLPLLLNAGKQDKKLRPLILPVLGNLGQWLARQNRQWEYGLGAKADADLASIQEIWATGSRSERSMALAQWREWQPVESRQALEAGWKREKADDRAAWLEVLQAGLSLADEEFLEVALVDRSEPVRRQAAHLLNQLPSQYRERLTTLASELLVIQDVNDKYKIKINLPSADHPEWIGLGILDKPKAGSQQVITVERLSPALVAADLDVWPQDLDRLIVSIGKQETGSTILRSFAQAAGYQQRVDWIEALITQSPNTFHSFNIQPFLFSLAKSDQAVKERLFSKLLGAENFMENLEQSLTVMMLEQFWSADISSLVIERFHLYAQQQGSYYHAQQLGASVSSHLHVSVLPQLQRLRETVASDKFNYDNCIELLEFRHSVRAVFDST